MSDDIERIKNAIDPVAFISTFTPLTRRGNRYWGLSPFTNEKTPSFTVRQDGLFYCFSTGVGGDIIRFIELKEGLSFREALERAAEFAGVTLTSKDAGPADGQAQATKAAGYELLRTAAAYFQRLLLDSSKAEVARAALQQREFGVDAWQRFGLGYAWGADEDWTGLVRKKGWSIDLSRQVGLTQPNQNIDRFKHRLMFPILDTRGNNAGFGGRRLNEDEAAKYINSADSMWFHKGQLLFAYTAAQPVWRERQRAILCEGYTDVMRLHMAGYAEAVAPLGTALTPQQASRVASHVKAALLAFDGDAAGAKAALNAWSLLVQRGIKVQLLEFPSGEDPDSFVRKSGSAALAALIEQAPEFWPAFLEQRIRGAADIAEKRKLLDQVVDKLATFQDAVLAELLCDELAAAAGVSAESVRAMLARQRRPESRERPTVGLSQAKLAPLEEKFAAFVLNHPEQRFELSSLVGDLQVHPWLRDILTGRNNGEPGFREWSGRVANMDVPPEPVDNLLAGVRELAGKRAYESKINELKRRHSEFWAAGDIAAADALSREIQALMER